MGTDSCRAKILFLLLKCLVVTADYVWLFFIIDIYLLCFSLSIFYTSIVYIPLLYHYGWVCVLTCLSLSLFVTLLYAVQVSPGWCGFAFLSVRGCCFNYCSSAQCWCLSVKVPFASLSLLPLLFISFPLFLQTNAALSRLLG